MSMSENTIAWWQVMPNVLWTDWLIYVLLIAISLFVFHARRHEHLRAPWRQILRCRMAMSSCIILLAFATIGLLDSVHFRQAVDVRNDGTLRYSNESVSLFDQLVLPLKNNTEKTYSSPFATHLYAKENIEMDDGSVGRDYPRLKYAGVHLLNSRVKKSQDIQSRIITATWHAALLIVLLTVVLAAWQSMRSKQKLTHILLKMWQGEQNSTPWKTIIATVGMIILLVCLSRQLATVYHVFGTDKVGQDVFYLTLKSIRTGLVIGTLTTLIMLPFAIMLGIMAGYFRGWIDDVIQYIYTTLNSIPSVLLIVAAVLMIQVLIDNNPDAFTTLQQRADVKLLALCFILGITSWTGLCRLLRGESLKLREADYIQAAQAFGVSHLKIITRHILPNVMHIVLILVVLDFSGLVLAEAVLSYVGVGVDPSMISWGNMINGARLEMAREPIVWWSLMAAFIFMLLLVLTANLFADAVRDAFDPRLRSQ